MTDHIEPPDDPTEGPIGDLGTLRQGPLPPADLEARVLAAARSGGLIRGPRWRARWVQLAAAALLFLAGAATGRLLIVPPAPTSDARTPARYLLLLAGDVTPSPDGDTRATEYGAWARGLAERGIAIDGEELTDHAAVVSPRGSTFRELSAVGGFFLIEAESDEAAAALARTCPHVKYGGSVVVRKVVP
jgi:hypothetical protein